MKTVKSILIATALLCGSVFTVSAQQEAQPAQKANVAVGDSVMIRRECTKYLTGETPSTWVWDKVHTVHQIGSKRDPNLYPDGILLWNIRSWVCDSCIVPVNGRAEEAAREAAAEQAADREAWEQAQRDKEARLAAEKAAAEKEAARIAAEKAAAEEAARIAAEEEAARIAAEKAAAEEAARLAAEEEAARLEQAKADSIKSAQKFKHNYDRFTIGVRGGASALMHETSNLGKWGCGGDVVLDLQYAHYWAKDGRPVDLGIIVGLGIGYQQSSLNANDNVANFDTANVYYSVSYAGVKETDHQLQLEVPLMFSLIHDNGFFFNVGPKFMIPVYNPYKQTVDQNNTHISAYFPEYGITIVDKDVTGHYAGQQPEAKNGIQFNAHVMLTAELGYEWVLKSGNSLGLGAYANYGWNLSYKNNTSSTGLFQLDPPTDASAANLTVLSATHAYANKLGYFDAGIKLAYHFNFPKKHQFKASKLF
jgi:nucleoid-associated protein YgaU